MEIAIGRSKAGLYMGFLFLPMWTLMAFDTRYRIHHLFPQWYGFSSSYVLGIIFLLLVTPWEWARRNERLMLGEKTLAMGNTVLPWELVSEVVFTELGNRGVYRVSIKCGDGWELKESGFLLLADDLCRIEARFLERGVTFTRVVKSRK